METALAVAPEIGKAPACRDQLASGRIHLDYGKYGAYRGKFRMNQL